MIAGANGRYLVACSVAGDASKVHKLAAAEANSAIHLLPRTTDIAQPRLSGAGRYRSQLCAVSADSGCRSCGWKCTQLACRIGASHGLQIPLYYRKLRAAKDLSWETGEDANWGMTMQTLQSTRTQAQVARTREAGMVVIIRGVPADWAVPIGEALLAADVDVMEITLNTPQALEMIAALRAALGEQMVIGAGTVLSVEDAEHALAAGAEFFVSPHLDTDIVAFANEHDCMVVPGAFTPTEVFTALRAGASIVKVFPANIVGPQFFKDLQGPFGRIPLLPTGGITVENAATYIHHGALALGVGAGLLDWQSLDAQFDRVTASVRAMREAVMQARREDGTG